jgi:hypothetical protein
MMIEGLGGAVNDWAQGRHQQRMGVLGDAIFGRTQQPVQRTYDADKTDVILAKLRAERDKNWNQAAINLAAKDATLVQFEALKAALAAAVPNHPLLQMSNEKYRADGKLKSRLRLMWESAFDKRLKEISPHLGANPKTHRKD